MPYQFSHRFYLQQAGILFVLAAVFFVLSRYRPFDLYFSDLWFDPQINRFPLTENYWLEVVNHHYVKYFVIAIATGTLILGIIQKKFHWIAIALIMASGPAIIGLLKSFSHHSCPWDLIRYGGSGHEYPLLGSIPEFPGDGRCFPGGHASGGFGLMAFYFLLYPISRRMATWAIIGALSLGMIMGYGQVMRGAHFFSHNLWTIWWVWSIQLILYYLYTFGYYRLFPDKESSH
ncbi:phosphatase PAP2 family protein [Vibrio mangrovi]|uniref:PAP2 superfamily protein n=1 Tax=Vibrio mangrovi TaxID=474394 RepID=A0A1Y6IYY7_9VIBR|nr:phosphatase PAP2 family protein [Vibrio mangrovi]MDW6005260.1 phosphatase PAP2 family protein [Vibrio mangrovi]SMS02885.1 PAP2 superfamily protein [Vibrio mangrovi]